jgi:hypothetical protein
MVHYASVIQKLQRELADVGIVDRQSLGKFPLDIYAAKQSLEKESEQ